MELPNRASGYSLIRFGLNSPDAERLARFYEASCSAVIVSREQESAHPAHAAALRITLQLGDSILDIREFAEPGAPYPGDLSPYDQRFQHVAIVVAEMSVALQRLSAVAGWRPISTHGPQTLPPAAGGVVAFKFRDPDGHPLEFLQFPPGHAPPHWTHAASHTMFLGIDHSAISVRHIERSVQFYHALGLTPSTHSLNEGIEQQRLDGVRDPQVDVIGLSPRVPTPHVELLHYRTGTACTPTPLAYQDIAATRLMFATAVNAPAVRGRRVQDPDGHFIELAD